MPKKTKIDFLDFIKTESALKSYEFEIFENNPDESVILLNSREPIDKIEIKNRKSYFPVPRGIRNKYSRIYKQQV